MALQRALSALLFALFPPALRVSRGWADAGLLSLTNFAWKIFGWTSRVAMWAVRCAYNLWFAEWLSDCVVLRCARLAAQISQDGRPKPRSPVE